MRKLTQSDVDLIAECDAVRSAYFCRDPDRPDSRYVRSRSTVPPEVKRAKGRLRTSRYRSELDRLRKPTVKDVAMALAVALATTNWQSMLTPADYDLLHRALDDLVARGFDRKQAALTMRGLRNWLVDPAERAGEPSDGWGEPILVKGERPLPF